MTPGVKVQGLREVVSALREADAEAPKRLREHLLPVARLVASRIASKVPRDEGDAAASLSARAGQRGASVAFGGSSAPYFPWLDYGGSVGKGHRPGVPWSGSVTRPWMPGGRYVYPTIAEHRDEIAEAALDAMAAAATGAGLKVS